MKRATSIAEGSVARSRRWIWLGAAIGAAALLAGCASTHWRAAKDVLERSQRYEQQPAAPVHRLLIIGDSTGVGTGAEAPALSVGGRLGRLHPDWRIDNRAVNGARARDLMAQLALQSGPLDLVLIMVGGNDVMRGTAWPSFEADLLAVVSEAQRRGGEVVLLPCGDVGQVPLFLPPITWWLDSRSDAMRARAERVAAATGVQLVDLRTPRALDPFVQDPARHHAADGLHPSGAGYALWTERLLQLQPWPSTRTQRLTAWGAAHL